jgi:hypothetical protein
MTYDKEANHDLGEQNLSVGGHRYCRFHCAGRHYLDKWGEEWIRQTDYIVIRIRDGCLGGWFNGKGLTLLES